MQHNKLAIRPGSEFFVGRDQLCSDLITSTRRNNAVLLFGGRQSGKTTLLLRIRDLLARVRGDANILGALDIPVYVDLTSLKYDAIPEDFFQLLVAKAKTCCEQQIIGFRCINNAHDFADRNLLEKFVGKLNQVSVQCGEIEPRFVFLLDESKRVLGDRFPRGFQDNLFSLLFGEAVGVTYSIAMVFAGAQHLYAFSQDDTSPIGSRAIAYHLKNLSAESVRELTKMGLPNLPESLVTNSASLVWDNTGGQAGLVAKIIEELAMFNLAEDMVHSVHLAIDNVTHANRGLLENWTLSLSAAAHVVALPLSRVDKMPLGSVAAILQQSKIDRFLTPRVIEEFEYMGLAIDEVGNLVRRNNIFWNYFQKMDTPDVTESSSRVVWDLIEETELAMRELIREKFGSAFGAKAESVMSSILGTKAWTDILGTQAKSVGRYKFSMEQNDRDIMSCMYFGHLNTLMISGQSWSHFKHMFRDKREIEDKVGAITPVRNDRAHFAEVPAKELDRCRIACDDLLVIVERELEILAK